METKKKIIKIIMMISVFVFSLYIIFNAIISGISDFQNEKYNIFCIEKGHNTSTDRLITLNDDLKVECDNTYIYNFKFDDQCIKFDKWGDCTSRKMRIQ
jgi:amino acid transporter